MTLLLGEARALVDGARARAVELGKALSIAVVDYGGFVVLIERMDGARPDDPGHRLVKGLLRGRDAAANRDAGELAQFRSCLLYPGGPNGPAPYRRHQGRFHAQA